MNWHQLIPLRCGVQHYAWGARGHGGRPPFIAGLLGEATSGHRPYAELWLGAHPSQPSVAVLNHGNQPLGDLIAAHPEPVLGARLLRRGVRELPFLLKLLDCQEPLSIQAHPDQALAERLHQRDPAHYPDANHKPEIAIALTPFRALCGFRPWAQVREDLSQRPALRGFFGADVATGAAHAPAVWLRQLWSRLFTAMDAEIAATLDELARGPADGANHPVDRLCLELARRFPGDRGCIAAYFLNSVELAPGQAVFLGAGEPHAYLHGTIVECMANSDNVVRAGLTAKFIDREVLLEMLTYRDAPPEILPGRSGPRGERIYEVPTPEFQVEFWRQNAGDTRQYSDYGAVSLLLVLSGVARLRSSHRIEVRARPGTAWLWPAAAGRLEVTSEGDGAEIVRAAPAERHSGPQTHAGCRG
jgi:mannose-6-phosphate isomerase